jgi:hypothetical protein
LKAYLSSSVENFTKAIELEPKKGLFHLGLASVMEAATVSGLELQEAPGRKDEKDARTKEAWQEGAIGEYLKAFELSYSGEVGLELPIEGARGFVSYEAGERYLTMVERRGAKEGEGEKVERVKKGIKSLEMKPMSGTTPIVFATEGANGLSELLDPAKRVKFDLDGTGRGAEWPWVKPGTAILVWDPKATGRIESGRQLFGSVTWWIFWKDGYAALDALDDDRDGWLSGEEMKGLAVWRDWNGNGVSDAGEVMSVESMGVEAISGRGTGREGASPMNARGIRMKDGRVVGSFMGRRGRLE